MKMTYVDPQGNRTVGAPADSKNIPVVNVSQPIVTKQKTAKKSTSSVDQVVSSAEEFRKFIEVEVLKIIKKLAEGGKTPKERIQDIARRTLELIKPGMTLEELYNSAVKLDDYHPELAPVVFALMKQYEQEYEKRAIEQVSAFVRSGKYNEAQELVKKVLEFKIGNNC
jgi:hypothetical protein